MRTFLAACLIPGVLWASLALATCVALWPALWVDPPAALGQVIHEAAEYAKGHVNGNFFLGRITDDPGPLFYPIAYLWRASPATLIGLGAAAIWARRRAYVLARIEVRRAAPALVGYVLFFALVLTFWNKMFDRYFLPAFPLLDIVATLGWAGLAETLARAGRIEEVIEQLETGVDIARQIGDLSVESRCLTALVEAERRLGNLEGVAAYQDELMHLEERLGNRPAAAKWAFRLGTTFLDLGRPNRAAEAFARAHQIASALRDVTLEQRALGGLGLAYTAMRRPSDALESLMQALAGLGQIPRAREYYHRALDLNRRLGQTQEQLHLLSALAGLAVETHQFGHATALYEQALQIAIAAGDRATAIRLHGRLGRIAQQQRDDHAAIEHYRRALDLAETIEQPDLLGNALLHLATAQHAVGDPGAISTYRRALTIAQQRGDVRRESLIRLNLGVLLSTNEAIVRSGGTVSERDRWPSFATDARPSDVARDNRRRSDDELFSEMTLPPQ